VVAPAQEHTVVDRCRATLAPGRAVVDIGPRRRSIAAREHAAPVWYRP